MTTYKLSNSMDQALFFEDYKGNLFELKVKEEN